MSELAMLDRAIGPASPPFIVAEMSGNHNRSLERALAIIDAAAAAGAHGLKLQTYTADSLTLDVDAPGFTIDDPNSLWTGRNLHSLYEEAATPYEWHEALLERCAERGIIGFSTPFDEDAVDFLEELSVPCYKIASFELIHIPLIKKAAATGKPMIISTGMATIEEIEEAVTAAHDGGCHDIVLLKCTSSYPASPADSNILTIPDMRERFGCQVGLSDHTIGIGASVASVALGATVIERHFTLARADGGVDAVFSMEPAEMALLVEESEKAWLSLGKVRYGRQQAEDGSLQFRRSIYVASDVRAGDVFTQENLRVVRPGYGLHPRHFDQLLGERAAADATAGTPMSWDLVER